MAHDWLNSVVLSIDLDNFKTVQTDILEIYLEFENIMTEQCKQIRQVLLSYRIITTKLCIEFFILVVFISEQIAVTANLIAAKKE
jgi:hypothetical protein